MVRRSVERWLTLFEAQAQSGLTAAAFCREQGLCPKYFSLRKKALGFEAAVAEASPFVRVMPSSAPRAEIQHPRVHLRFGRCEWELTGFALNDLTRLMAALA